MTEDEMTLVAEPYFLAIKGAEKSFNYAWSINGNVVETPTNQTELTVRPESRGGYANLSFNIESLKLLFQNVTGV